MQVVRSTDRGATWSGNLLSITNGKNPAIAINSLGTVAIAYQQISGTGATQRWETHYRELTTGTSWNDSTLCTALSQAPARSFSPYIGDYLHMMAVGKDFYGVFSANNTPDLSNFPQGVTYLRNHDFATKRLFGLNGVTVVNASIDPFFFKVTKISQAASDYYVRDWTDSTTTHDTGLEPSTNPVFYVSSDVWNQRTNAAPTFVNDQPQSQDPQNNAGNFAFARVSRNNAGSAETVNVQFLVAEFGTGSPYHSVASTTVAFAAGDTSKIASAGWTLPATTSTHLCLGVQVSTAGDPFVTPGLNGMTPGWPTTDLVVINDNNKAQRNMSVHYGLSKIHSIHYLIIRNASRKVRDFELAVRVDDAELKQLGRPRLGAQGSDARAFKPGSTFTVAGMKPRERRWVSLETTGLAGESPVAVDLQEVVDGTIVNGARFLLTAAKPGVAWRELVDFAGSVLGRLAASWTNDEAAEVAKALTALLTKRSVTAAATTKTFAGSSDELAVAVDRFLKLADADADLGIATSRDALLKAAAAGDQASTFDTATTLFHQLDVAITLKRPPAKG